MLIEDDIDILCICETWLDSSVECKYLNIPNFKLFRCDTGRGGGTCIFVREVFNVSVVATNISRVEGVDDLWIQVHHKKFPAVIVGCIYRHPRATAHSISYLSDVFKDMCLKKKPIFI